MTPAGPVRLRLRDPRLCTERSRRRGDMSHLTVLLCCLILSFLSSCGNNEALTVTQSPPSITVKEGEMVHMQCCWGGTLNMERVRVIWNKTNTSSDIINTMHNKDKEVHVKKDKYSSYISGNCSKFTISSVSTNDTGVYLCNIHIVIPTFKEGSGSGTQLTVNRINNSSEVKSISVTLIPLAAVMGAICLCAFLCYWRKKKRMPYPDQASGKVGMVIHEVPHEEGEEIMEGEIGLAENEAGSTGSSHGSTQWCAVAVYESVDYFAVQTSEDG
ncbi:uncharacterized protein LOC118231378 [Anguilla anguilla]|uniref:uncharacterized protein LOC118231378 n=1 Tax=Anguilla anguilla TaxID=7936 RepID=UPI0015AE4890|nr:uncharacterized protein LOC118231378 [Anguilla anguilla]